jgi:flagellar hook-basal body complex protein FliE
MSMPNSIGSLRILPVEVDSLPPSSSAEKLQFSETLASAMDQIDQLQGDAQARVESLLQGNGGDVHSAMIAVQKAELSFELMMQVRNKIVQAYQEISRLQF